MLIALLCLAAFTHHSVYKITLVIPDFLGVSLLRENPLCEHSPKKDAQPFEEICGQRVLPRAGGIALCGCLLAHGVTHELVVFWDSCFLLMIVVGTTSVE